MLRAVPEILAGSSEFRQRNAVLTLPERRIIQSQMNRIKSRMVKPKFNHPVCVKGNVLLHSHLLRKTDSLSTNQKDDLRYMLHAADRLVEAMISVCQSSDLIHTAINCIDFQQRMTQALWVKDSPLLQLPHFSAENIKTCGKHKIKTIPQYRELSKKDRSFIDMTELEQEDIEQYLKLFPDIKVSAKVFVDDEEDSKVYEGDTCIVRLVITRINLRKGEKVGFVHSPFFPFPKEEALWVVLGQMNSGRIVSIEKLTSLDRVVCHDIKFVAPPVGHYKFDLFIKSNGYVGADQQLSLDLETLDNARLPDYTVHPDDAELDNRPSLFEDIVNSMHIEPESDDEDNDDCMRFGTTKQKVSRREHLRSIRLVHDEDSDDGE